jgi:pimeloyl-ACP methyl ester carboxylesterase
MQPEAPVKHSSSSSESDSMLSDLHDLLSNGKGALRALASQQQQTIREGLDIYTETYMIRCFNSSTHQPPPVLSIESSPQPTAHGERGPRREKILMVMGFAAPGDAWRPVINAMLQAADRKSSLGSIQEDVEIEIAIYDNRGIGRSTIPSDAKAYTTEAMAKDAVDVMAKLGWSSAHIVGFSMGGMISLKIASLYPEKVRSLMLLSVTGGGWEVIPVSAKSLPHVIRALTNKSIEGRAATDVSFHFSSRVRSRKLGGQSGKAIHDLLVEEYVETSKTYGKQHPDGEKGHINAVWTHEVSEKDLKTIRSGDIPIKVLHGDDDMMALPHYGVKLAKRLGAPVRLVDGGHFTPRENAREVGEEIFATVLQGQKEMVVGRPVSPPASSQAALRPKSKYAYSSLSIDIEGKRKDEETTSCFGRLFSCCM